MQRGAGHGCKVEAGHVPLRPCRLRGHRTTQHDVVELANLHKGGVRTNMASNRRGTSGAVKAQVQSIFQHTKKERTHPR